MWYDNLICTKLMDLETQINKEFDDWFNELVGFSFRSEWFYDDLDHAESVEKLRESMKIWIKSAFREGYSRGMYNPLEQKEKAKKLALDLRDWSQNEEMIDQYFTKHGIICNEAAELLEKISDG